MHRTLTWSYGGGTQSIAIALLIVEGRLPQPEVIAIADTSREASETWEYTEQYVRPLLEPLGLCIDRVSHQLATVDLYSHKGELLIPAFTETGKLETFCSTEWKARVCRRHLSGLGYGPKRPVVTWLGMSRDEIGRLRSGQKPEWQQIHYPLVFDVPMNRADCRSLILRHGLPEPPKSSCWMCPHRRNSQWRRLRDHYPDDWAAAIALDHDIRNRDEQGGVWLHPDRVALDLADIDTPDHPPSPMFGDLDGACESGYCYV